MLNKKGLHYVDWVISMGTFVIAIIAILVYLKPGVKPEYNRESLLSIVETNFFNETGWMVRKVPLFIHELQNPTYVEDRYVDIDYSTGFSFNVNVPSIIDQNNDKFRCMSPPCNDITLNFVFYPNQPLNKNLPMIKAKCVPPNNLAVCDAEFGSSETLEGLNNGLLTLLSGKDYNSLKISWNYPLSRDFAIYVDDTRITSGPEPPQQANVFVKDIKYWKLSNQGVRTQSVVNIRAW